VHGRRPGQQVPGHPPRSHRPSRSPRPASSSATPPRRHVPRRQRQLEEPSNTPAATHARPAPPSWRRRSSNRSSALGARPGTGSAALASEREPGAHHRALDGSRRHRQPQPRPRHRLAPSTRPPAPRRPRLPQDRRVDGPGRWPAASTSATETPTAQNPCTKFVVPSSGSTSQ
jgi:hypothetical protein